MICRVLSEKWIGSGGVTIASGTRERKNRLYAGLRDEVDSAAHGPLSYILEYLLVDLPVGRAPFEL